MVVVELAVVKTDISVVKISFVGINGLVVNLGLVIKSDAVVEIVLGLIVVINLKGTWRTAAEVVIVSSVVTGAIVAIPVVINNESAVELACVTVVDSTKSTFLIISSVCSSFVFVKNTRSTVMVIKVALVMIIGVVDVAFEMYTGVIVPVSSVTITGVFEMEFITDN